MKARKGSSLVEVLMVSTLMVIVLSGATAIVTQVLRSYQQASTQLNVDTDASKAVQWLAQDLQEAKQVTILTPSSIRVYYPVVATNGTYTRTLDTVNVIDYYRGNLSGPNSTGPMLVRAPAGGTPRAVCTGVTEVTFSSFNTTSVDVTLRALHAAGTASRRCDMVHRAIFLRNY